MFKTVLPLVLLCTLLLSSVRGSPASLSSLPLHARATNTSNNLSNVDGSKVFKDCVQRYNTSRMKPLPQQGYHNPNITNGSMITTWLDSTPGEPLNVIISSNSSEQVLCPEGFLRYATSIQFGVSCLGNVNGSMQYANLGDGFGIRSQGNYGGGNGALRWNYGNADFGTCKESVDGGNHFRWFLQNGSDAFTGAIFLAASMEEPASLGHMIQTNGYNTGRDYLVGNATMHPTTDYKGFVYHTEVEWIPAGVLLNATSDGINHPEVALPGQPVQDGRVALLTVTLLSEPGTTSNAATTTATLARRESLLFGVALALLIPSATLLLF